jgi:hypothetical protein
MFLLGFAIKIFCHERLERITKSLVSLCTSP